MNRLKSDMARLQSSEKLTRIAALVSLARRGESASSVVPDLLRLASRITDRQELALACETLGEIGDARAVPFLIATLERHLVKKVGKRSADSLGRIGDPAALPSLVAACHSPNHIVRSAARRAEARIKERCNGPAR